LVEGAPLLRVYTPKAYRGFESLSLRHSFFCDGIDLEAVPISASE
jgi:hypothetical protein